MAKSKIWLSSPHMSGAEQNFVNEAFETNWIAPLGPHVDGFEHDLEQFTGAEYAAALSSGTAALHLALIMLGVQRDDTVICQSFTFSASANPIAYQCAVPVFVDSEKDTWNMDPELLEEAIIRLTSEGRKPKAVILVHLYGMPAKINEIMAVCNQYQVPLIEDAAEALGSTYNGQACGTFGKLGVLSFNGNKIITTSGGGALLSSDEILIKQSRFLATQARDAAPHYQHSQIGYNYRLSNVSAAIGRGQMTVLAQRISQRRKNFDFYRNALNHLPGLEFLNEVQGSFSNRWLTTFIIDADKSGGITRENIRLALESENIESRPLWKPMHLQPVFEGAMYIGGTVAEDLFNSGLCLPSGSNLTDIDLERVVQTILNCFNF